MNRLIDGHRFTINYGPAGSLRQIGIEKSIAASVANEIAVYRIAESGFLADDFAIPAAGDCMAAQRAVNTE
jgi:hypothetical protein